MTARNTLGVAAVEPPVKADPACAGQSGLMALRDTEDVVALLHAIGGLVERLSGRITRIEQLLELLPLLLATAGVDPTHVPIETAALMLGVSVPTIRRRIRRKELRLDVIAGSKCTGILIEDLSSLWIPLRIARAALARERDAFNNEKKEPRLQEARARMK